MRVDSNKAKKTVNPPEEKITVHNVFLLDRSQSMQGAKYENAISGVNLELAELRKSENVNLTQTIVEFDYAGADVEHYFMTSLNSIPLFRGAGARGMTALYQATGELIEKLLTKVGKQDKVLLKIFTDGGENASSGKWNDPEILRDLIKKVEKENGFTVTFEGTAHDTLFVVKTLGINKSNTLVHNNTAEGILRNSRTRTGATISYMKAVADGEDVTANFYAKSVE